MGLERGDECYCGDHYNFHVPLGIASCDHAEPTWKCPAAYGCGGDMALSVWQISAPAGATMAKYQGNDTIRFHVWKHSTSISLLFVAFMFALMVLLWPKVRLRGWMAIPSSSELSIVSMTDTIDSSVLSE